MYKSEPKVKPILITHANMVYELKQEPLGPIRVLALSQSNFKVDLTSYYKKSTTLQYLM